MLENIEYSLKCARTLCVLSQLDPGNDKLQETMLSLARAYAIQATTFIQTQLEYELRRKEGKLQRPRRRRNQTQ